MKFLTSLIGASVVFLFGWWLVFPLIVAFEGWIIPAVIFLIISLIGAYIGAVMVEESSESLFKNLINSILAASVICFLGFGIIYSFLLESPSVYTDRIEMTIGINHNEYAEDDLGEITILISNNSNQNLRIMNGRIRVPDHFLEGFIVSQNGCTVSCEIDQGWFGYYQGLSVNDFSVEPYREFELVIPIIAKASGNFPGEFRFQADTRITTQNYTLYWMTNKTVEKPHRMGTNVNVQLIVTP